MNNMDLFIKYEQDMMSEKEKEKFEKKLHTSSNFRQEYDLYKEKLSSLSTNIDVDEQYFVNLLPNVRTKMDKQKSFQPFKKIVYVFPVVLLAVFLTFELENNNNNFYYNFDEWFNEFTNDEEVIEELFVDALSLSDSYLLIENSFEEYSEEILELSDEEIQKENLGNYILEDAVNEDFIQKFSEDQFNEVYSILIDKKIL